MAIKINIENAFDYMEWEILFKIVVYLGFHSKWISWIRGCITYISYSLLINGNPYGHFRPSRRLKQCDPLSSFLVFILGTEILSRLIAQKENIGHLRGISINRINGTHLSHILFANDLILFGRATLQIANSFKSFLDKYSHGQDKRSTSTNPL